MTSLAVVPKPHSANISKIADFAEVECLRSIDENVSVQDVARAMQRETDSSSDEHIVEIVHDAFGELANRREHCGPDDGRYPYELIERGSLLQIRKQRTGGGIPPRAFYVYLLLATRMNMQTQRSQGGEDATVLFEHLSKEIAERFWGGPSSSVKAVVFGTGRTSGARGFEQAVNDLCKDLGEGYGFRPVPGTDVPARDGGLDVVVWRSFADKRPGQLIGFGQCKTGTHWSDGRQRLQPQTFTNNWMKKSPAVTPVRLYFVADRVVADFHHHSSECGILFDRCRIIENANRLSPALLTRITKWVNAACKSEGLRRP